MQDITDLLARVGELLSGVNVQRTIVRETAARKRAAASLPPARPVPSRESALIFRDALRVAGKRPNDKGVLISMGSTVERQDQIEAIRAFVGYDDKRDVFGTALSSAQSTMRRILMGPVTEAPAPSRGVGFTPGSAEYTLLAKAWAELGAYQIRIAELRKQRKALLEMMKCEGLTADNLEELRHYESRVHEEIIEVNSQIDALNAKLPPGASK